MHRIQRFSMGIFSILVVWVVAGIGITPVLADDSVLLGDDFKIKDAKWDRKKNRLTVKGKGDRGETVTLLYAGSRQVIDSRTVKKNKWKFKNKGISPVPCNVRVEQSDGQYAEQKVRNAPADCNDGDTSNPPPVAGNYSVLAANDLGMHCADQDFRVFSILPPYNVINAQVVRKGREPELMTPNDGIQVTYQAAVANIIDPNEPALPPIATDSINSTSENDLANGIYKSNFWEPGNATADQLHGFLSYFMLYPENVLAAFPLRDMLQNSILGLPAPDIERLYLGDGVLAAEQSAMPGKTAPFSANQPQPFHGYVKDLPFFINFPFGYVAENFNRYTAEGIPILPIDDAGRRNPYPLMRIDARDSQGTVLASVHTVLPVASEADCQGCHLEQEVCTDLGVGMSCGDIANYYDRGAELITLDNIDTGNPDAANYVPGDTNEQIVINAAKINILRVHDAKHGTNLDSERHVVCANCHYSPALDLAHLGPSDANGKEQTRHQSMSRVMHGFHGGLPANDANDPDNVFDDLFPVMPMITDRDALLTEEILEQTCYACHPGKQTKCLRGAMAEGGMVCQDCHGQSTQVGNDFTQDFPNIAFPNPGSADLNKRVPWASEPKCQSCHVGDVLQVNAIAAAGGLDDVLVNPTDKAGNVDGLRLRMAYRISDHVTSNGGSLNLGLLDYANSRFASDKPLYRLSGQDQSKGHGGVFCEGCHGSTHAIWPNGNPFSNDNKTAMDLQGHTGTITECTTCHEGDLGITLDGPHGMHPVGATRFAEDHEDLAENDPDQCRACHGRNGEGTVLSRAAMDRTLQSYEGGLITIRKGTPIGCATCHENELSGNTGRDDDDDDHDDDDDDDD